MGEGKELVWLCRVGDDYGCDMVVDGKVVRRRIDIVAQ